MNPGFFKTFLSLGTLLFFCTISKAQVKKDSSNLHQHFKAPVKIKPLKTAFDSKSVYKFDSMNSRMPVLALSSNDKMPVGKLMPEELQMQHLKPLNQDSLKLKLPGLN